MHELKTDVTTYAAYELVVKQLREGGPLSAPELARRLQWTARQVSSAVYRGRLNKLIVPLAENARFPQHGRARRYSAAHVPGWPLPADDT